MPSPELLGILGFVFMFVLLAMGLHIGISLGVIGFIGCALMLGFSRSLSMLVTTPYYVVANYAFIVLPMFIFMGEMAFQGGIGILLYKAASKWLGRLHGGLAMATTAAAAALGAITGSTLAAAATFVRELPLAGRHADNEFGEGVANEHQLAHLASHSPPLLKADLFGQFEAQARPGGCLGMGDGLWECRPPYRGNLAGIGGDCRA